MRNTIRAVLAACLLFACSSQEQTYTVETVDGVRHVHNHAPLQGDEPEISLEFVQKLGKIEGQDENYLLFGIQDVKKGKHGNTYIVESGNDRVQIFDPVGTYLKTIGRKGQGPGEFINPKHIVISPDENIIIADNKKNVSFFDHSGEFTKIVRFPPNLWDVQYHPSGYFLVRSKLYDNHPEDPLIRLYDNTGKEIASIGSFIECNEDTYLGLVNNGNMAVLSNGNIVFSFTSFNRIDIYDIQTRKLALTL